LHNTTYSEYRQADRDVDMHEFTHTIVVTRHVANQTLLSNRRQCHNAGVGGWGFTIFRAGLHATVTIQQDIIKYYVSNEDVHPTSHKAS